MDSFLVNPDFSNASNLPDWWLAEPDYRVRRLKRSDTPLLAEFLASLSKRTLYYRFLNPRPEFSRESASDEAGKLWQNNPFHEVILVATNDGEKGEEVIGLAELLRTGGPNSEVEMAIVIADRYQSKGLGTVLLQKLINISLSRGLKRWHLYVSPENSAMLRLLRKLGYPYTLNRWSGDYQITVFIRD